MNFNLNETKLSVKLGSGINFRTGKLVFIDSAMETNLYYN